MVNTVCELALMATLLSAVGHQSVEVLPNAPSWPPPAVTAADGLSLKRIIGAIIK